MNRLSRGLGVLLGTGLLLAACGIKGAPRPPEPPPPPPAEAQPSPQPATQPPGDTSRGPLEPSGPAPSPSPDPGT